MAEWAELVVGSLNAGAGTIADKVGDWEDMVADGAQVILGQEMGDQQDAVARFLRRNPNWRVVWQFDWHAARSVAILYDGDRFELGMFNLIPIAIGWLGPKGAGPTQLPFKVINRVRLKDKLSGRWVRFLNIHAVVSKDKAGLSKRERRARRSKWRRQVEAFWAAVRASFIICIGGGDWNDLESDIRRNTDVPDGWVFAKTGPTRRQRRIDMIGWKAHKRLQFVEAWTRESSGSRKHGDHLIVLARFRIWVRGT